ncbi:RlpA-like double-psi beta-barrel domain-containing protein [Sabulicella glaciei]|uniref:Endolytic peptidoglycan transglycosylase RlpA n=1 Tax=Sabulicella glaciei TaxID=2984948 RepID=A0ABT3NR48_9PROT|nr:RlpA-like double-psi beta-barrel domain-containing protein [Roseococcus sp. MDT2-1-1]MCW8084627.1 SPOR domain-containing protein [Roseococcus sp. MDT2-1-1]
MKRVLAGLAALALLASCGRPPPPGPEARPRYVVGEGYNLGGQWSYPREDWSLDQTGIAETMPRRAGLTANGERHDASALVAAHRTLPLPSIVTVTNLENGRSLRVRVHDRGPERAGRVIAVSPRATELLGARGPFQARVTADQGASRLAGSGLEGHAPALAIAAAPVGRVERESLAAPEGARVAAPRAETVRPANAAETAVAVPPPERLPEQVTQGAPMPGRLWTEAGSFFRADFARTQAARLGMRAEPFGPAGRQQVWRVRGGPYATLAEADEAFARALRAGQQELRLVVE